MVIRRVIFLFVLANYLLVSSLSGLGHVVICHDSVGGVASEREGATCCAEERGDSEEIRPVAAMTPPATCDCCTDIPLGDMPSKASSVASASKCVSGDAVPTPALAASLILLATPDAVGLARRSPSNSVAGPPASRLQGIILRC